jgi:hypothetical protein
MINHLAINLVTKGLLNMSNITKGMIIIGYEIVLTKKKGGGSSPYVSIPYKREDEKEFFNEIKKRDDIDVIKVKIDWKKKYKGDKLIEGTLIKSHIETQILNETGKHITVELINN